MQPAMPPRSRRCPVRVCAADCRILDRDRSGRFGLCKGLRFICGPFLARGIALDDLMPQHFQQICFRREDVCVPVCLNVPVKVEKDVLQNVLGVNGIGQMHDRVAQQRAVCFFINLVKIVLFHVSPNLVGLSVPAFYFRHFEQIAAHSRNSVMPAKISKPTNAAPSICMPAAAEPLPTCANAASFPIPAACRTTAPFCVSFTHRERIRAEAVACFFHHITEM